MRVGTTLRASLLSVGVAVALCAAPSAHAAPSGPTCSATALSTLCQRPGNAQIVSTPPVVDYQAQLPYFGGFGFYPFGIGGRHR
ncbi:hypothetical protein NIIDNTM18_34290 [Mycolicibacterium litorale]|uniref:Keratin associated protein n=1 Tax=Mycolicibacterium litorale TaxID=758802 RepID=A0A6S6P939_9MYCO|nr:hypothetical protein [Mycolicibacterium litorale]BCI54151.1 hypothetical protein NIIDNTM18_34290 [Mycolicibacterium litorale]